MRRKFVVRTPRHNRVKINGKEYEAPNDRIAPEESMDGRRWIFGLYENYEDIVYLWGSEDYWKAIRDGEELDPFSYFKLNSGMLLEEIDGTYLPWMFWRRVG